MYLLAILRNLNKKIQKNLDLNLFKNWIKTKIIKNKSDFNL